MSVHTYNSMSEHLCNQQHMTHKCTAIVIKNAKPSMMGFASRICCSIHECCPLTAARNCRINLVLSVLPAPDSPLHKQSNISLAGGERALELSMLAFFNVVNAPRAKLLFAWVTVCRPVKCLGMQPATQVDSVSEAAFRLSNNKTGDGECSLLSAYGWAYVAGRLAWSIGQLPPGAVSNYSNFWYIYDSVYMPLNGGFILSTSPIQCNYFTLGN